MHRFLERYDADVTGALSGFDRLRFRGTLRLIANARGLMSCMSYIGVLVKDFKPFALKVSERVRAAAQQVAAAAGRPLLYHQSATTDKETAARELAARDGIQSGLIGVWGCVERCRSFDLRSDKAKGWLVLESAVRKCQHYYFYYWHERFGFMHVRVQSWLPFNVWVCLNGREWLAQELSAASVGFTRRDNAVRPAGSEALACAQALLAAQVTHDWQRDLAALAQAVNPQHATLFGDFPLHYYWSLEESEWATDLLFRSAGALKALYPRFVRHGVEALSCTEVMRYLGKRVNRDGSVPLRFAGEVLTDLRPANVPAAKRATARRGAESVRLKHRINHNWLKMYDKTPDLLRVETVINDPHEFKVYRRGETEGPEVPKRWMRLRKGVVDVPRRAEVSQQANSRYIEALAAVDESTPFGDLVGAVCRPVRCWKGRRVRGLNPLATDDAELLAAVNRGEFTVSGFRNRDLRACLFGAPPREAAKLRRQSGQITRRLRMLRAHGLIKKIPGTHRYQATANGRVIITALLTARAANTRRLLEAA
jgi:hypothetical protein